MKKRAALLAVVCSSSAAVAHDDALQTSVEQKSERGLNLLLSGVLGSDPRSLMPLGFLVGGAYEGRVSSRLDANLGMSFERFPSAAGPVIMASVVDLTLMRRAQNSVFVGIGAGPVFAQGKMRPGGRMFAGIELFHQGPLPAVQIAAELLAKFCGDDATNQCPAGETQTWLSGRIGVRL
jgi:hypothetical protein